MIFENYFSIKRREKNPNYIENRKYLARLKDDMNEHLESCDLCPWECRINRFKDVGKCNTNVSPLIHIKLHSTNEEEFFLPCAMVFTSGCNLRCFYCQNPNLLDPNPEHQKSIEEHVSDLKNIALHSTSIHFCGGEPLIHPQVICDILMHIDLPLPILINTNMYLQQDLLEKVSKICDVFITDMKFGNNVCAKKMCGAENYFDIVTSNHYFVAKTLRSDIVIRHLVLPGHIDCCTRPVLEWFKNNLDGSSNTMLNITLCFNPDRRQQSIINKRLSSDEKMEVVKLVEDLKLKNIMISRSYQDMTAIKWWK